MSIYTSMIPSSPHTLRRLPLLMLALAAPLAHAQEVIVAAQHAEGSASGKDSATLQAVHVTAVRSEGFKPVTVKAGTFRGADVMDVPSTINVVTSKVLEAQAAEGLYDAVRNTAGVTRQQNGGDTWDQLVIRGVEVQNRTNYRLNGSMPIMNFSQVPMENKARVEVHDGHGAVEAVVGAVLHFHATDDQLVPSVAAVLLAGDTGRVAHGVVQAFGSLCFQHLAGDDVDGGGYVHHVGAAEGAGLDGDGLEAFGTHGGDMHGLQCGVVLAGSGAFSAFGRDDDFLGMGQGGSKGQGQHQRQPAQGVGAGGDHEL